MRRRMLLAALPASVAIAAAPRPARAGEALNLAVGQKGSWNSGVAEMGLRSGIFARRGIQVNILYTQSSAETLQAVLSGNADLGVGVGTVDAMDAFANGAPVRIATNQATGAADLFWYVKNDSPIHAMKQCSGRIVAYAAPRSPTNSVVLGLAETFGIAPKLVATGDVPFTFNQVMSGLVDVGWSTVPYHLDAADAGQIRILAYGNNVPGLRSQTVRVNVTHAELPQDRRRAVDWLLQAQRDTVDWMYASPAAVPAFADFAGVPEATVQRMRRDYFPKTTIWPDTISGLDALMADAVRFGFLAAPLTGEQLARLIQNPGYALPRSPGAPA
jgi:NitT/TauT family transport system substrate-binding protein